MSDHDEEIRAYLGEFDPPPDDLFPAGTLGHALMTGVFNGLVLHGNALKFEILGTKIVRRPEAEPTSQETDWCAVIDYRCKPASEIAAWQKASWNYFGAFWLAPLEPIDVIKENFARREVFDPGDFRNSFREACRPRLRPDTLPAWIESELLRSGTPWATAEVSDITATLYCDSIVVAENGQLAPSVKATQRLEFVFPNREPVVTEQELVIGALYPEAYTAPAPSKPAVVAKFLEQLVKKQSKKLEAMVKKLGTPEDRLPSELLLDPNPIVMLQKALKINSILES